MRPFAHTISVATMHCHNVWRLQALGSGGITPCELTQPADQLLPNAVTLFFPADIIF
jgi:hypothetical protein